MDYRIGHGYDVHALQAGRALVIGGVTIPYKKGLMGHSDADVLAHAVMDAILGALALGDIGKHFPNTNARFQNANSMDLLEICCKKMCAMGYKIGNLDCTIVAQKPKMAPYLPQMRKNLARAFRCELQQINVKATTEEGMGFTGQEQGIAAHSVCMLKKIQQLNQHK